MTRRRSPAPSPNTAAASGASGRVLAEPAVAAALPDGGGRRRDLGPRTASALILAPLGILALVAGGALWAGIIVACAGATAYEWAAMAASRAPAASRGLAAAPVALPVVAAALALLGALGFWLPALVLLALCCAALALLVRPGGRALAAGLAYVGLAALALLWLRVLPHDAAHPGGMRLVLLVMLVVWSSDTGAYAAGRLLGGRKLAPRISPAKTWSGAAGGLAAAVLVGAVFGAWTGAGVVTFALVALLLGVASQSGDLAESAAKRRFGVKDSGRLIPGHGGLLDRLDGLMAAAPLASLLVLLA